MWEVGNKGIFSKRGAEAIGYDCVGCDDFIMKGNNLEPTQVNMPIFPFVLTVPGDYRDELLMKDDEGGILRVEEFGGRNNE